MFYAVIVILVDGYIILLRYATSCLVFMHIQIQVTNMVNHELIAKQVLYSKPIVLESTKLNMQQYS